MLANVLLSDIAVDFNSGVKPQALATGTTSGSAIPLGGPGPLHKLCFDAYAVMGTASGVLTMALYTATASGGSFTSVSGMTQSVAISNSLLLYDLRLDTRNEAFSDLNTNALWVQPVLVLTGVATSVFLKVTGWESGIEPARRLEALAPLSTTVQRTELDIYSGAGYSAPN